MPTEFVLRSQRVLTGDVPVPASIHVRDGRVAAIEPYDTTFESLPLEDVGDSVVIPGIVDTHVHINDPGRSEWEGFETATRAAAAGGVTTLMDMPLNSVPPTTTVAGFEAKALAAEGRCHVDVGFCGGVVPSNADDLKALVDVGVLAFKCFLCESGVPEFGFVTEDDLSRAMPVLESRGVALLVHAELPGPLASASRVTSSRAYGDYVASRPRAAENEAVAMLARQALRFGTRTHIVHLASSDALRDVMDARAKRAPLTVETCPHYLTFAAEEVPDGATEFKCAPPIRERTNRDALWAGIRQGAIDQVVTDHSPSTPSLKCMDSGDFMRAWGGIASLQLGLPAVWTEARARGFTLADVVHWMCEAPAKLARLSDRKGRIAPGFDADFAVWNPDAPFMVDPVRLEHRHKITPYAGRSLCGVVERTYVRGECVFDRGSFARPSGQLLRGDRR